MSEPVYVYCESCKEVQHYDAAAPFCCHCEATLFSIDIPSDEEIKSFKVEQKLKRQGDL